MPMNRTSTATRSLAPLSVSEALAVGDHHRWLISSFDLAMVDAVRRGLRPDRHRLARCRRAGRYRGAAAGARPPRTPSVGRHVAIARPSPSAMRPASPSTRGRATTRNGCASSSDGVSTASVTNVPDIALAVARRRLNQPGGTTSCTASGTWTNSRRFVVAEVVAVDLIRERRVVLDHQVRRGRRARRGAPVGFTPPPRSAPPSDDRIAPRPHRAERDRDETSIERGRR